MQASQVFAERCCLWDHASSRWRNQRSETAMFNLTYPFTMKAHFFWLHGYGKLPVGKRLDTFFGWRWMKKLIGSECDITKFQFTYCIDPTNAYDQQKTSSKLSHSNALTSVEVRGIKQQCVRVTHGLKHLWKFLFLVDVRSQANESLPCMLHMHYAELQWSDKFLAITRYTTWICIKAGLYKKVIGCWIERPTGSERVIDRWMSREKQADV